MGTSTSETRDIRAPSAILRITDLGRRRRIVVAGQAVFHGVMAAGPEPIETVLSVATLERMVEFRGDWWRDEMARRDDPSYVSGRLLSLIGRFGSVAGASVLDIGSGCGSSGLVLAEAGAARVVGVEPDGGAVELARLRAEDEGVAGRVVFHHLEDCSRIPSKDGEFDLVTFNAVVEHIAPRLRHGILREADRCLRPGGLMVFNETPNRAFPYDNHTTRLPLIPWLSLRLAYPLAKRFSRHIPRGSSLDHFIIQGLVGGSYWEIRRLLPELSCLNLRGGDASWKCGLKSTSTPTRRVLEVAESLLNNGGLPLVALMPSLDIVFEKPARPV